MYLQAVVRIFFDVKEATDGTKYLVIDESRHSEGDSYTHNRMMVFEDNVAKFMEGLMKAVNAMANEEHSEDGEDKQSA